MKICQIEHIECQHYNVQFAIKIGNPRPFNMAIFIDSCNKFTTI